MLFGRKIKNPIKIADKGVVEWKYTTCGYCSTGCSIEVGLDDKGEAVASRGVGGADVNRGKLCLKGIFEHELFRSAGRGTIPLIRDRHFDEFKETTWDTALDSTLVYQSAIVVLVGVLLETVGLIAHARDL